MHAGLTLRRLSLTAVVTAAVLLTPAMASADPPSSVRAFYLTASTNSGLQSAADSDACYFANHQGPNVRLMLLDFGSAYKSSGDYGVLNFSGHFFINSDVLHALKAAADAYHRCKSSGSEAIIAYGNNSSAMQGMIASEIHDSGQKQMYHATLLRNYENNQNYGAEGAAAGADAEVGWDGDTRTRALIEGATDQGGLLDYDYGDAQGCPSTGHSGSCSNGWNVGDVAYISFHGVAVPAPEIYYNSASDPINADQWTVVRRNWDNNHAPGSDYVFFAVTSEAGAGLSPGDAWQAINFSNPHVQRELICFGCG